MHTCLVVQIIQVSLSLWLHGILMSKVVGYVMGIVVWYGGGVDGRQRWRAHKRIDLVEYGRVGM